MSLDEPMPSGDRGFESGDVEYSPTEPPEPEDVHMPDVPPDPNSMPMDLSQFFQWLSAPPELCFISPVAMVCSAPCMFQIKIQDDCKVSPWNSVEL